MSAHNNARLWAAIVCLAATTQIVRGGSHGDAGEFLEERFRLRGPEDQGYFTVGFRLAESVSNPAPLVQTTAAKSITNF